MCFNVEMGLFLRACIAFAVVAGLLSLGLVAHGEVLVTRIVAVAPVSAVIEKTYSPF